MYAHAHVVGFMADFFTAGQPFCCKKTNGHCYTDKKENLNQNGAVVGGWLVFIVLVHSHNETSSTKTFTVTNPPQPLHPPI